MAAATLVCCGMLAAARVTANYWHRFLLWNLFLAWLPYAFSLWAVWLRDHRRERPWKLLLPAVLWLLFLPNAPYPITDFIQPYKSELTAFFANVAAATEATDTPAPRG